MATEEGLRIKLGATVDQLKSDINQAKAAISGLAQAVGQESSQVAAAGKNWNQLGKFIFDANYERRRMIQQINQGIGSWKLEATAVNNVANNAMPALSRNSKSASTALTGLTRIAQDAPYGFLAIGNNISETIVQMQNLVKTSGSTGGALKAIGTSLIGPGGVVLGLNLLITGITVAVQKYGSLGGAVDALLGSLSEQEKLQNSINETVLEGSKNAQRELVDLDSLYRTATNVNIPLKERTKIVDELQKRYPDYLGNLSDEKILSGAAAGEYNKLRDAILGAAQARAIGDKLAENEKKRLPLIIEESKLRSELTTKAAANASAQKQINEATKEGEEVQNFILQTAGKVTSEYSRLNNQLKKNQIAQGDINEENRQYVAIQKQIISQFGSMALGVDSTKKGERATKNIQTILRELKNDIDGLNLSFSSTGGSIQDLAGDKISRLAKALKDLAEFGVVPGDKVFQQIDQQIKLLQNSLTKTPITLKIPIVVDPLPKASANVNANFKALVDSLGTRLQFALQDLNTYIQQALKQLVNEGITTIADGLGSAIAGAGIGKIFAGIGTLIGDFLQNLGKQLIAYGTTLLAFKLAIRNLDPYVALAAGAAAVIAGAIFKQKASQGLKLAQGGITNGPTMAMIGDNPSGKEVVAPLERLQSMLGGGYNGNVRFEIEGTKLVGILDRYDKLNNRG